MCTTLHKPHANAAAPISEQPDTLPWLFDAIRAREQAHLKRLCFLDCIISVGALLLDQGAIAVFITTHSRIDDAGIVQSAIRMGE